MRKYNAFTFIYLSKAKWKCSKFLNFYDTRTMEGLKLYIFPDIDNVIMTIHFQKVLNTRWLNKCI